jgi:hypothetical protein
MHLKGYKHITKLTVGWDGVVSIVTCYGQDGLGIKFQIFHTCPDQPRGPSNLLYNGYQITFGVKWSEHGVNHPPPSSAEAKVRVELYLYSPTVPS